MLKRVNVLSALTVKSIEPESPSVQERVEEWKCDGVIIHIDRGCYGGQVGTLDAKWDLDKAGIPNLTFEGSQADCRLFNERDTVEAFYTFFETMGLQRMDS